MVSRMIARMIVVLAMTLLFGLTSFSSSEAGSIVVNNDEWTLSNLGFSQQPVNTPQFAINVASFFTGGGPGNFLVYSSNFGLVGSSLQSTMTGAGHTWTINTSLPFTLANLLGFDAVFLGGGPHAYNASVLISYVIAGGNVYLVGGTAFTSSVAEANTWNPFLNAFGLGYGTFYNGVTGSIPISSPHPIFSGITALYQDNGNNVLDTNLADPQGQVLVSQGSNGLYGVFASAPTHVLVDHYRCYTIKPPTQVNKVVTLKDQFRKNDALVVKSNLLCAPVSKNGEPVNNPDIHLEAYQLKDKPLSVPQPKVRLNNQFGTEETSVKKPVLLLVPTTKERLN